MSIFGLGTFLALLVICYGDDTACTGRADGWIAEIGCWGYDVCSGGKIVRNACPPQTVYDRDSKTCVEIGTNSTDCGKAAICSGLPGGSYGDIGCKSYYVCDGGKNIGRIYCPGPLVYDAELTICNWPADVLQPCGTKAIQSKPN